MSYLYLYSAGSLGPTVLLPNVYMTVKSNLWSKDIVQYCMYRYSTWQRSAESDTKGDTGVGSYCHARRLKTDASSLFLIIHRKGASLGPFPVRTYVRHVKILPVGLWALNAYPFVGLGEHSPL
jgi:hypothetical protein